MTKKTVLVIMDGYGIAPNGEGNAIARANTPNLDKLFLEKPNCKLNASGLQVGLPDGQMGNSEVGHTNIGAGRIVYQILPKINKEIEERKFFENEVYLNSITEAVKNDRPLHIMGLLSDGGVHSHIDHIFAMIDMAVSNNIKQIYVHCFLDGRDVEPTSGIEFVRKLNEKCLTVGNAKIASIHGRYYAMDRDKRWERLEKSYNAIVCGEGIENADPIQAVKNSYDEGITDEFVVPVVVDKEGTINKGDSVIFMNFRPDRARELTYALNLVDFDGFKREKLVYPLNYVCTAQYDENLTLPIAYPPEIVNNTIGELVSAEGLKQFRVAETEKYAHVTFFFNGGIEKACDGEERCLVPSPRDFATYDLVPEMSANQVCDKLIEAIASESYSMIICNFANCDMVGHTGVIPAAIKAVETVDACIGRVYEEVEKHEDVVLMITADHGNADCLINSDGSVNTKHTTNLVPFIISDDNLKLNEIGKLADIAPTMLEIMNIKKPDTMTGISLIKQ